MKVIVDTKTTGAKEGLESLLGEKFYCACLNYSYAGVLVGVNDVELKLSGASIVYETGEWNASKWKDAQALPTEFAYVRLDKIESYFVDKK